MTTRVISWLSLLDQQEIAENKKNQIEYQFSSPGGRGYANDRTHADGHRVFRADHATRGAYDPTNVGTFTLTWLGVGLMWAGSELTWEG